MVYNCLHGKAPSYLTDCCTPISDFASRRRLCSASRRQLFVPRHNLSTYGRRAFSVAGPAAWNCLCDELREPLLTANSFRSYLKLVCLLSTSAYSALEVLHIMRYINLLTYLLYLREMWSNCIRPLDDTRGDPYVVSGARSTNSFRLHPGRRHRIPSNSTDDAHLGQMASVLLSFTVTNCGV